MVELGFKDPETEAVCSVCDQAYMKQRSKLCPSCRAERKLEKMIKYQQRSKLINKGQEL